MLKTKQLKAIELLIKNYKLSDGISLETVAEQACVTRKTLYNWMHKDEEFIAEYETQLRSQLRYAAGEATKTVIDLMKSKSAAVSLAAARDILDRAGYKPTDKMSLDGAVPVVISGGEDLED